MDNINELMELANSGDAVAQYKLGRAYENGDGVEKDLGIARHWYQTSADNGNKNAAVKLRILPVQQEAATAVPAVSEAPKQVYQAPSAPTLNIATQTQQTTAPATAIPAGQKSKVVAALLALCLGGFGAHDFYLGYTKQGIIKIILTVTVIASFVSGIWTLLDLIKILCNGKLDSNGQPLV